MLFWLIPLIVIGLCLLVAIVVIVRKIPQLAVMDVEAMPTEKVKKIKERIILQKFERMRSEKVGRLSKWMRMIGTGLFKAGRRIVQRLYRLEQYYQKIKQVPAQGRHAADPGRIKQLMAEAETFMREDEYIQAEKRYIEVISHNPKYVEAYEGLGNLYIRNKQHAQARETLVFALRLDAENASLHMSMAELELKEGNGKAAVEQLRKATEIRPKNVKYLDSYIEAALAAKMTDDAERGLKLMKEANPENQKIPDFQHAIDELKPTDTPSV